jgi:hypothetical protein
MDLDFSKYVELSPDKFITGGKQFEFVTKFENSTTEISVLSYVKLKSDGIYKLTIKGNYNRGSTAIVSIGNINSTIEQMYNIALASMCEIIPMMVEKDYPDSLKKVEEDRKNMKT